MMVKSAIRWRDDEVGRGRRTRRASDAASHRCRRTLRQSVLGVAGAIALLALATPVKAQGDRPLQPVVSAVDAGTGNDNTESKSLRRELYVPLEHLDALLGKGTERVFLQRDEFERLLRMAGPKDSVPPPPIEAALLEATYRMHVTGDRAMIEAELVVENLGQQAAAVRLPMQNVGILAASLDGDVAHLTRAQDGTVLLLLTAPGVHRCEMQLVAHVQLDAAQQSLDFRLPVSGATRMHVIVPGDVEVKRGITVVDRQVDRERGQTHFDWLLDQDHVQVVMSLNNKKLQESSVAFARSVLVSRLASSGQQLHVTSTWNIAHGAIQELRVRLSSDLEVRELDVDRPHRWFVTDGENGRELVIQLRSAETGTVVVRGVMDVQRPVVGTWELPTFHPVGVEHATTLVGVVADQELRVSGISADGMMPLPSSLLSKALPATLNPQDPQSGSASRLIPVAAFYAPDPAAASAQANVELLPGQLHVASTSAFIIADGGVSQETAVVVMPRYQPVGMLELSLPPMWSLESIELEGAELVRKQLAGERDTGLRVTAILGRRIQPGQTVTVRFSARWIPTGWMDDWTEQTVTLQPFHVAGAERHGGALEVRSADDLDTRVVDSQGLIVLSASEKSTLGLSQTLEGDAYQFRANDWSAQVSVTRRTPRQIARTLNFVQLNRDAIRVHADVIYLIESARADRLEFSVPVEAPHEITVRTVAGPAIKETRSEVIGDRRHWYVTLAERATGKVTIAVDWVMPKEAAELQDFSLPTARAENVAYQSGAIAVEGDPELDVIVKFAPPEIDVGELAEASRGVGRRVLGVYGYLGADDRVVVDVTPLTIANMPGVLVERSEVVVSIDSSGQIVVAQRLNIVSKLDSLQCELPDDTQLWSVVVDGQPALPHSLGDRLLINLPPTSDNRHQLTMMYAGTLEPMLWRTGLQIALPNWFPSDAASPVPIVDQQVSLYTPAGVQVVALPGGLPNNGQRRTELLPLPEWFVEAASLRIEVALPQARFLDLGVEEFADATAHLPASGLAIKSEVESAPSEGLEVADEEAPLTRRGPVDEAKKQAGEASRGEDRFGDQLGEVPAEQQQAQAMPADSLERSGRQAGQGQAAGAARQPAPSMEQTATWGLQGVRSLAVVPAVQHAEPAAVWNSNGEETVVDFVLVDRRKLWWMAVAIGALIFGIAIAAIRSKRRWYWLVLLAAAAWFVPPLILWDSEAAAIRSAGVVAAIFAAVVYLLADVAFGIAIKLGRGFARGVVDVARSEACHRSVGGLLLIVYWSLTGGWGSGDVGLRAQQPPPIAPPAASTTAELNELLELLRRAAAAEPVAVPKDAVVIPYDPEQGITGQEKLLVSWDLYKRLLEGSEGDRDQAQPAEDFAWNGGQFRVSLAADGDTIEIRGRLRFTQFVDHPILIPLPMSRCIVAEATLNGQAPTLHIAVPEERQHGKGGAKVQAENVLLLHSATRGEKELSLTLRCPITRQGGWRIVDSRLPTAIADTLEIHDAEQLEVRCKTDVDDLTQNPSVESEAQPLRVAIGADGRLMLRWRERVSSSAIEEGLTAQSNMVFDVREDMRRLVWRCDLSFRGGPRDALEFSIPAGYLVERVDGENIRTWRVVQEEGEQRLVLELLKEVQNAEQVTIVASQPANMVAEGKVEIQVPRIEPIGAMLHHGTIVLRASERIEARIIQRQRATQIDAPGVDWIKEWENPGIVPLHTVAAVEFSQGEFDVRVEARMPTPEVRADVEALLKIAQLETTLEARIRVQTGETPLFHLRVRLPREWAIDNLVIGDKHHWRLQPDEADSAFQILELYLPDGWQGEGSLVLIGRLGEPRDRGEDPATVRLPQVEVLGATEQRGTLVVQTDPAYSVRARDLEGCRVVSVSTADWLNRVQRTAARTAIHWSSADYAGTLQLDRRQPRVRSMVVVNVKVTERVIEETILISATIQQAGIEQFEFDLPLRLADARIQAPLLRDTEIVKDDQAGKAHVKLQLQDAVMGQWAVLVEADRLRSGQSQEVPIPTILTGTTQVRIVALENASTDELEADRAVAVEELDATELATYRQLGQLANNRSTVAYRVDEQAAADTSPQLSYRMVQRQVVQTAQAAIGLAESTLVVDALGGYRAAVEYRVENRTEPFLDIDLPADSRLLTALVAGEGVKAAAVASKQNRVRIPLIKTAEGELDYPVVIKYAGRLTSPGRWMTEWKIPLPETVNISVRRTQVRLYLPDGWNWYRFAGTLGVVESEQVLAEGWLSLRLQQLEELASIASSNSNAYARARAVTNLERLGAELSQQLARAGSRYKSYLDAKSSKVARGQKLLDSLASGLAETEEVLQEVKELPADSDQSAVVLDNRATIDLLYFQQQSQRSLNQLGQLGNNFALPNTDADTAGEAAAVEYSDARVAQNAVQPEPSSALVQPDQQAAQQRLSDVQLAVPQLARKQRELRFGQSADKEKSEVEAARKSLFGDAAQQAADYQRRLSEQAASGTFGGRALRRDGIADQDLFAAPGNQPDGVSDRSRRGASRAAESAAATAQLDAPATATNEMLFESADIQAGPVGGGLGGGGFGGEGLGGAMEGDQSGIAFGFEADSGGVAGQQTEGYLAGLSVDLPQRGQLFMFTTPGGDAELTVYGTSHLVSGRAVSALWTVIALLFAIGLIRFGQWLAMRVWSRRLVGGLLILLSAPLALLGAPIWIAAVAGLIGLSFLVGRRPVPASA